MSQDLRFGLRLLARNPLFTTAAVLTMALGIGANTAVFSLVNAYLLKSPPWEEAHNLLLVQEHNPKQHLTATVAYPNFVDWREKNHVFEDMTAASVVTYNVSGEGTPERIQGMRVTQNFFSVFRGRPALGRTFLEDEDVEGRDKVVVLSQALWARRFGSDPNVLGRPLRLDSETYTVVGVMPAGFRFPDDRFEIWAPLAADYNKSGRDDHFALVVARLKQGVKLDSARAEMAAIARQLEQEYPDTNTGLGVTMERLQELIAREVRLMLTVLTTAVAFVLLIACSNVSSLLLARGAARAKEVAIRTAMGAGRRRIIRQMLTESVVISVGGGILGALIATWAVNLLSATSPPQFLPFGGLSVDRSVLAFTLLISVLTGCIFGIMPALRFSSTKVNETLKEGGRSCGTSSNRGRLRSTLVVTEVALALVLLIGAGLLIKSFARIQRVDPGFRSDNILTAQITLPEVKYSKPYLRTAFYRNLLERTSRLPGVEASAAVSILPLSGGNTDRAFVVEGRPAPRPGEWSHANFRVVTPSYFQTMAIPVQRGRGIAESDEETTMGVVVVNRTMAERYWPNADPVGSRIKLDTTPSSERPWLTVAGVVGDVKQSSLSKESAAEMYLPHTQQASPSMTVVLRTGGDPAALTPALRAEVKAIDGDQPLARVQSMERVIADSVTPQRTTAMLIGIFGTAALALAVIGLYGVIAFSVTQHTHDLGIRMALGARPSNVLHHVVGEAIMLTAVGVAIGLVGAAAVTRVMASLLFQVEAMDPVIFAGVPLVLVVVALAASYVPARRASRIDPIVALRHE